MVRPTFTGHVDCAESVQRQHTGGLIVVLAAVIALRPKQVASGVELHNRHPIRVRVLRKVSPGGEIADISGTEGHVTGRVNTVTCIRPQLVSVGVTHQRHEQITADASHPDPAVIG